MAVKKPSRPGFCQTLGLGVLGKKKDISFREIESSSSYWIQCLKVQWLLFNSRRSDATAAGSARQESEF
jgi:hypothetical protein